MRIRGSIPAVTSVTRDPPLDDGSIFDEAPRRAVDFEPRALRPRGHRWPLVAGVWAAALVALVGIGLLDGGPANDEVPGVVAEAISPDPARDPWPPRLDRPSTRMGALLLAQVIELEAPSPARVTITTPTLEVAGTVLVRAERVRIALEARGNRVVDHVSVSVADPDGGVRPELAPAFEASFDLPFPRPNGTMWVVVTAYDEGGMPLGSTRRPFTVGPLMGPGARVVGTSSLDGNWPWRPYGDFLEAGPAPSPLPICRPISATLASSC